MPDAPASSKRATRFGERSPTRTSAGVPQSSAVMIAVAISEKSRRPCSKSRNRKSAPAPQHSSTIVELVMLRTQPNSTSPLANRCVSVGPMASKTPSNLVRGRATLLRGDRSKTFMASRSCGPTGSHCSDSTGATNMALMQQCCREICVRQHFPIQLRNVFQNAKMPRT